MNLQSAHWSQACGGMKGAYIMSFSMGSDMSEFENLWMVGASTNSEKIRHDTCKSCVILTTALSRRWSAWLSL